MKKHVLILTAVLLFGGLSSAASVQMQINKTNMEPAPLQTSEYGDVWLEVTNDGDTEADNVEVTFNENYPFSVDPGDKTSWDVGNLIPGETYQIHLELKVDENAVQGANQLKFTTSASPDIQIEQKVPVEVRSDNNILAVQDVNLSEKVAPGSSERMELTLQNMADSYLKNVEVKLDLSDSIPLATQDSAVKNLEKISPGNRSKVAFNLQVDESAENGVIRLPIQITYENEAGTEFTQDTSTAVVVGGKPQLEVGINSEGQLAPGSTHKVTLRVVNRGYGSAEFTELRLEGGQNYEVVSSNSVYLGEMDADDYQTAEFDLYIEKGAESLSIPVELDYRSERSQKQTETLEPRLYTQSELKKYGLAGGGSPVVIGAVLVLILAGGIYYWRRRKD